MPTSDEEFMRMALQLASIAKERTSPNPMVGAILVKNSRVIGFGAHLQAGKKHAEIHALDIAGADAQGSTLYITLEPCAHYGKTPPCANALVQAGISRAVIAMEDPFPLVAGKGIEILRAAGIEVTVGVLEHEARTINKIYLHYVEHQRPYVTLKIAASLDGFIAASDGTPLTITGKDAQIESHRLRNAVDGIIVGVNTIISDNPQLTTRVLDIGRNPIRFIFDRHLRIPLNSRVVTDPIARTVVFCHSQAEPSRELALQQNGVEVLRLQSDNSQEMICEALLRMGEWGLRHLLLEGGSTLTAAFLAAQMVDEVWMFHAPLFFTLGWPAFKPTRDPVYRSPIRLNNITRKTLGDDELMIGNPIWKT